MFTMKNVQGHVHVYDFRGNFLFSADSEREAREELKEYAESAHMSTLKHLQRPSRKFLMSMCL